MNYVVDASAVIPYLVVETYTPNSKALFAQISPPDLLIVPEFCKIECVNVLWKYVRFNNVLLTQAEKLVEDLQELPLAVASVDDLYVQALQIGVKHQLAIYDSVYIALAKQLNYPLISVDQRQIQAATSEQVTVKALTDFVQ